VSAVQKEKVFLSLHLLAYFIYFNSYQRIKIFVYPENSFVEG